MISKPRKRSSMIESDSSFATNALIQRPSKNSVSYVTNQTERSSYLNKNNMSMFFVPFTTIKSTFYRTHQRSRSGNQVPTRKHRACAKYATSQMLFKTAHTKIAKEKLIPIAQKNFMPKKSLKPINRPNVGTIT